MNFPLDPDFIKPGTVALVGSGPGDPDLLTIGAVKALRCADAVVFDALVSPEIMAIVSENCEQVFAGKRGGRPSPSQEDISDTIVRLAKQNKRVVRLKGGDPFVFGRGGEEALRLVEEGIPFKVVPGLTSGIAGPAYAGIPVTHRTINSNVALITGHESLERERGTSSRINWEEVGRAFPVLVLYMAIKNLPKVCKRLMAGGGRAPQTPVAVIQWATTPKQRTLVTTLERVVADVETHDIQAPAIIVVGDVVSLREKLAWFGDETLAV